MRFLLLLIMAFPLLVTGQRREVVLPVSPSGEISHLTTAPDGQTLIAADDKDVFIYELTTHRLLLSLTDVWPRYIIFSPDSRSFTICHHQQADVYSSDNLKLLQSFKGIEYELNKAAYSHNSRLLAVTGIDNSALIFDLASGIKINEFEDSYYITDPVFSTNDSLLKIATNNNRVVVWDIYFREKKLDTCLCDYAGLYEKLVHSGLTPLFFAGAGDTTYLLLKSKIAAEKGIAEKTIRLSADGHYLQAVAWKKKPDGEVTRYVTDSAYSYDHNSSLLVWNYITGEKITAIPLSFRTPDFSFIGDSVIAYPASRNIVVRSLAGNATEYLIPAQMDAIRNASLTYSKKLLVAETMDNQLKVWDVFTGKLIRSLDNFRETQNYAADSGGTKMVFNERFQNKLYLADLTTAKPPVYYENDASQSDIFSASMSDDGKRIAFGTRSGFINVLDENLNKIFTAIKTNDCCTIDEINVTNDHKYVIAEHKIPEVWDISGNRKLPADSARLYTPLLIDRYEQPAVYNSMSNVGINYYLSCNGKETIVNWYSFSDGNYLILLPDGYYMSTPGAAKRLNYRQGRQLLSFEQLDVQYNRPDKVIEVLMAASAKPDHHLIQSYRKAYEKRIRKLGIDTSLYNAGFSIPEANFANRKQISFRQTRQELQLKIVATDSLYKLERLNIWVNETPVFGMRGINLQSRALHRIDTTISITLSDGDNRIETSVINSNGIESYRVPMFVQYNPVKKNNSTLYFIGIGIDHFADAQKNLRWSVKDIRDLAKSIRMKYGAACSIDTLFDQHVTVEKITALRKKLRGAGVNDKVIIAYSGHGLLSRNYDYYLSTFNIDFDSPEKNGLPYELLESLADSISPRQKLMLIDACHSGEIDKEEKIKITASADMMAKNGVKAKGIITESTDTTGRLGLQNSFELMQALFANVSRGTGTTVISAAAGTQFAQERNTLRNGVFTFSILEYMQARPHATISELKRHVNRRVPELTEGLQVPTARTETLATDWQIW